MVLGLLVVAIGIACVEFVVQSARAGRESDRLRERQALADERTGRAEAGGNEAADADLAVDSDAETSLTSYSLFI